MVRKLWLDLKKLVLRIALFIKDKANKLSEAVKTLYESILSTPCWAYFLLICIIVVLAIFYKRGFHFRFSENLMYGIAGSLVVSVLIDLGNTRRTKRTTKEQYYMLLSRLKRQCTTLASSMLSLYKEWELPEIIDSEEEKKNFTKMVDTIPTIINTISKYKDSSVYDEQKLVERCRMYVGIFDQCLDSINKEASFVYDVARRSEPNEYFNRQFLEKIDLLIKTETKYQRTAKMLVEYDYSKDYTKIISYTLMSLEYDEIGDNFKNSVEDLFGEGEQ